VVKEVEPNIETLGKKSLSGVLTLIFRTFFLQVLSFSATFLLTVFLEPNVFGVFFLVSAFVSFFGYFSDIGLAAALIQKKEIDDDDLKTTFTVQQSLVLGLVLIIFLASSQIKKWYGLGSQGMELLMALTISFLLSSLKTIPSVLLERKLEFNRLVIPQVIENLFFNLLAVGLAWKGWGLRSFSVAVLARGVSGLLAIYILSPWKISLGFAKKSFKRLTLFGIPYQLNTFVAVLKDDLMTVFLGRVIGTQGLGYLGWARKWAEQPLRFLMDNVLKVTFPAYSRMQDQKKSLGFALEKSIFFLTFLSFPILTGFCLLAPKLILIIPRYQKWAPALIPLYFYCFNSGWAIASTMATNFFNAIGKIKTTFKLMLMWLFLTWLIMPLAAVKYGYLGVAWGVGIIACSSVVPLFLAWREIKFSLINSIFKPVLASGLMAGMTMFLSQKFPLTFAGLGLVVFFSGLFYLLVSYLIYGEALVNDFQKFLHGIKVK